MGLRAKVGLAGAFTATFVVLHLASDAISWKIPLLAVPESVWEHIKLGFWAFSLIYGLRMFSRGKGNVAGLSLGMLISVVVVFALYYSLIGFTGPLGRYPLPVHGLINLIVTFLAGLAGAEAADLPEEAGPHCSAVYMPASLWLIFLLLFSLYTYREPPLDLFEIPRGHP